MKTKIANGWTILSKWLNLIFGGSVDKTWTTETEYVAGATIVEDGKILIAIVAGTTGVSEPTWPTSIDETVVDGTVTWKYVANNSTPEWAADTYVEEGSIVFATAGGGVKIFRALNSGTTDSSEPSWPSTLRTTVVDNEITWENYGGHLHDSKTIDGSAPKVLLTGAAEIEGTLPVSNQVEHVHSGAEGQFAKIPVADQIEHVHSGAGGQFAKIHPLNHILGENAGYFDLVFSDSYFATEQTVRIYYRFHYAYITGAPAIMEISIPGFYAQAHATGTHFEATGTPLSVLAPKTNLLVPISVLDDGVYKSGSIEILATGGVVLQCIDPATGKFLNDNWTAGSVNKGFSASCFSYPIFP